MMKFGLPDDVALFVAGAIKSNVRALEGSLLQLKVFSVMSGHHPPATPIRLETILGVVARKYSVEVKDIKGHQRTAAIALPRQVAIYLALDMTEMTLGEVAKALGGRDHSTIHHSKKKIGALVEGDPFFSRFVTELRGEIKRVENQ